MFQNQDLQEYLETSSVIRSQTAVIAEWNMNVADNILTVGNYRYRKTAQPSNTEDYQFVNLASSFDPDDANSVVKVYTGATDADVVVDGGYDIVDGEQKPVLFLSKKEKEKLLFSLEDCIGKFRPRSGINKIRYMSNKFIHHSNPEMSSRPRYYMADKQDQFKYWTSYRTENGIERGVANKTINGQHYIDDAAPFVVYNKMVPANRLVVKIQTNVGSVDLGTFSNSSGTLADPFYGYENQTSPVEWKIQYLQSDNWVDAISFNASSVRRDGTPIIGSDGYIELSYGLIIPEEYRSIFYEAGSYPVEGLLPTPSNITDGTAYWVSGDSPLAPGTYFIAIGGEYQSFPAIYGWYLEQDQPSHLTSYVTDLTSPSQVKMSDNDLVRYREFEYISGIRIVAETMNTFDSTLDLIEMSPRLAVDISDKTRSFSITKSASDLGISGLPVGQLLASTGSLDLFDYDQSFLPTNANSIISDYTTQNIQIKLYEIIADVSGFDYYIPQKTMYSEGFPQISSKDRSVTLSLRDMFFHFESTTAPQLLLQDASVSTAVATLLDYVGFSNYVFKRLPDEEEVVIPYFTVGPDTSVAQVLSDIAISSQYAMFFDEYNNFVVMSKGYMLPAITDRDTDVTLRGTTDFIDSGIKKNAYSNSSANGALANIIELSSQDNSVYNDGSITYSTKYIQRSYSSVKQASLIDRDKTWIYKPALLWEVSSSDNTKSVNDEVGQQSSYVLSAIPLNSDLTDEVPSVEDHQVINNVIDLGDGIYWLSRYNGYMYANGEIIKYDAVQYSIPGLVDQDSNVWISSVQEYQKYFAKIPFNGKLYPTGLIRIFSEPNYEVVEGKTRLKNGAVAKHGRAQFGTGARGSDGATAPVYHSAGLNPYWYDDENVRGIDMDFSFLSNASKTLPAVTTGSAGVDTEKAKTTTRNGIIKNFMSNTSIEEASVNRMLSTQTGTIQSSAFIMNGAASRSTDTPSFVSYVYKPLNDRFVHFGTRMRVIGKIDNNESGSQTPYGSSTYYTAKGISSDVSTAIAGASGGLGVFVDPNTNNGYYFEIIALTESNMSQYEDADNIHNLFFYKVVSRDAPAVSITAKSLTSGIASLQTSSTHKFVPGDQVTVVNVDSTFDGLYTIVDVGEDGLSFSYAKSSADIAQTSVSAGTASVDTTKAIPVKLWGGIGEVVVDNGLFTGQYRMNAEETPTVYDLAVEYQKVGNTTKFYLYVNNVLVKIVEDIDPLPVVNNMALFVRGSSRVMFENVYALTNNYSQNTTFSIGTISDSIFGDLEINASNSFSKYTLSGLVQSTYLSGIGTSEPPKYKIYFDEFGTIMREAAYFNVRYDKAYPALYAKISPTFNKLKGYTVSNFIAGAYKAEFMIFNATDTALSLDSTSGNYLRIQGVTFTQQSQHELTVDEFFSKRSDLSDPEFSGDSVVRSPQKIAKDYQDIKFSRTTYGKKQFSINAPYIQTQDDANNMMAWLSEKIMKPRKSVGARIFGLPNIQLGDVVEIDYKNSEGINEVASSDSRFVVYNIEYKRDASGPDMTVYMSEVK